VAPVESMFTTLAASHRAPAEARLKVAEVCNGWSTELVDCARVLVTELVTNAVMHGIGDIGLRITNDGEVLRVEVGDGSPTPARFGPPLRLADESGRGLYIVADLADSWGQHRSEIGGKTVWFELRQSSQA
jgi:anti-sigma regulatory factor (Ser/Thr protein kinase)